MILNNPFPSSFEEFIYKSRYARWLDDEKRRENWGETVGRLVDYYQDNTEPAGNLSAEERQEVYNAIYNLEVIS